MYSDEEKHAPTAEQTRSKVGTGILQGCLLVTQNMYWATGFEDVCHRVDRRKFWQISYFDGTVVSLFKGTFSARQVYLHLKPKLLHFFKEIVQQKLLDKDWIQSVHNRFCSSILWVEKNCEMLKHLAVQIHSKQMWYDQTALSPEVHDYIHRGTPNFPTTTSFTS